MLSSSANGSARSGRNLSPHERGEAEHGERDEQRESRAGLEPRELKHERGREHEQRHHTGALRHVERDRDRREDEEHRDRALVRLVGLVGRLQVGCDEDDQQPGSDNSRELRCLTPPVAEERHASECDAAREREQDREGECRRPTSARRRASRRASRPPPRCRPGRPRVHRILDAGQRAVIVAMAITPTETRPIPATTKGRARRTHASGSARNGRIGTRKRGPGALPTVRQVVPGVVGQEQQRHGPADERLGPPAQAPEQRQPEQRGHGEGRHDEEPLLRDEEGERCARIREPTP